MGSNSSRVPTELPHLVIVGGSFAGISLCLNVNMNFRITLIEKKEFFEWVTAAPYSTVDNSGYFDKQATIDYVQMVNKDKVLGVNVTYVQAELMELVDTNTIKIKKINGADLEKQEEELRFDYLTLCTGSCLNFNDKIEDVYKIYSKEKRSQFFGKYREKMEKAKSILVVGGGPTGVEAAGALLLRFKDTKKIGIVNSGKNLLSGLPDAAGKAAKNYLEKHGVNVYLDTKFNSSHRLSTEYEFVWNWYGLQFYTPFLDANFKDCKDKRGRIFVNEYFQVTNVNPCEAPEEGKSHDERTLSNIFWFGDACLTRMDEVKVVPSISQTVPILANNLKESIKDDPKFMAMDYAINTMTGVFFGFDQGVMIINFWLIWRINFLLSYKYFIFIKIIYII